VSFTNADGKTVGAAGTINLTPGANGKVGQSASFTLPAKIESVGIKVALYEKIEAVKVTVDSETGIGP
jgi:hypothetical protein